MSKTDIKKIESEDLKELSDEALDRAGTAQGCVPKASVMSVYCGSPA
ncbi:MAG: hypothetical protein ISR48_05690 [Alphaproteobacteria bacterium]|nr:hypothetical protein [Alphaproteobacteria bacterium]